MSDQEQVWESSIDAMIAHLLNTTSIPHDAAQRIAWNYAVELGAGEPIGILSLPSETLLSNSVLPLAEQLKIAMPDADVHVRINTPDGTERPVNNGRVYRDRGTLHALVMLEEKSGSLPDEDMDQLTYLLGHEEAHLTVPNTVATKRRTELYCDTFAMLANTPEEMAQKARAQVQFHGEHARAQYDNLSPIEISIRRRRRIQTGVPETCGTKRIGDYSGEHPPSPCRQTIAQILEHMALTQGAEALDNLKQDVFKGYATLNSINI